MLTLRSIIEKLGNKNDEIRNNVITMLSQFGEAALMPLLEALNDEELSIRFYTISILGTIPSKPAIESLLTALKDSHSDIRYIAASALGSTGDARTIDGLVIALKDNETSVRFHSAEALGKIGDERAIAALQELVQNQELKGKASRETRRIAKKAIEQIQQRQNY